jgi:hypothetical protein
MYEYHLVSMFNLSVFALMNAIPISHRPFIDVAIRTVARIQGYYSAVLML